MEFSTEQRMFAAGQVYTASREEGHELLAIDLQCQLNAAVELLRLIRPYPNTADCWCHMNTNRNTPNHTENCKRVRDFLSRRNSHD